MKPVTSETALDTIFKNNPVMFLNKRLFTVHYMKQLRALKTTSLTINKNALPTEIWDIIYEFMLVDTQDSYCWVRAVSWTDKNLHCREITFRYPTKCGEFRTKEEMEEFEETVNYTENQRRKSGLTYREGSQFTISLPLPEKDIDAFLNKVSTPDVIKYMEGGDCNLCGNSRRILTNKHAKKSFRILVYSPFVAEIICPLCIGMDEALEHCDLIDEYYDGGYYNQGVLVRMRAWEETVRMRGYGEDRVMLFT